MYSLICFVIGFVLLFGVLIVLFFDKYSKKWPSVEGEIMESSIYRNKEIGVYSLIVIYEYMVNGHKYMSDNIVFLKGHYGSYEKADSKKFNKGDRITVYYFPFRPSVSVLIPDGSSRIMILILLLLAIGSLFLGIISVYDKI